jgi:predicted DNA-binding protein (MmcQ/YjbR family)
MNIQQLHEFCLAKKAVTEHFPFDGDILVFKVGGKIFALTSIKDWENATPSVNLKCDPNLALKLREQFDGIIPGYHSNKKHWNTIAINADVPDKKITHLINHSYELVFSKLTKKIKGEIDNIEN